MTGMKVVRERVVAEWDGLDAEASAPLPAASERTAEVRTPALVYVDAVCPKCDLPGRIVLTINPELRVDASGSELRLQAKAKARLHTCGQLALPSPSDTQIDFDLEDIVGASSEDDAEA